MMPTDQPSASSQMVRVCLPSTFIAALITPLCQSEQQRSRAFACPPVAILQGLPCSLAGAFHGHRLRGRIQQPRAGAGASGDFRALGARGAAYRDEAGEGRPRRDRAEVRASAAPDHRPVQAAAATGTRPLALFIHGGYWRSLEPSSFSQMARGMNAHGVTVAVVRLRPRPQVSIGADHRADAAAACLFLWKRFGKRMMVSGHSAGGHLAACMVATDWKKLDAGAPADLVPAGYAISGLYDLDAAAASRDQRRLQARRRRGAAHLAAVLAGRARARARRRGRRRGVVGVPAAEQDHRRRLAREGRRDALRGGPGHEPFHRLRSDDRSEQRDDEAAGRAGERRT